MAISIGFDDQSPEVGDLAGPRLAPPAYDTIARDEELSGDGPWRNWPGPPMIMPAGLLPDGTRFGGNEMENARRICGQRVKSLAEAEATVSAYFVQQRRLRREAGLTQARRTSDGVVDTPETAAAILALHAAETARRGPETA
ncbi:hypothetical protein AB0A63_31710 [Lentzea sp. NPDC042327]|uniref:hypothetical protein n=1 Tax=Lentzea sp. NPDC042327 TaxID=3154801 RepID=UPI0033CF83E9